MNQWTIVRVKARPQLPVGPLREEGEEKIYSLRPFFPCSSIYVNGCHVPSVVIEFFDVDCKISNLWGNFLEVEFSNIAIYFLGSDFGECSNGVRYFFCSCGGQDHFHLCHFFSYGHVMTKSSPMTMSSSRSPPYLRRGEPSADMADSWSIPEVRRSRTRLLDCLRPPLMLALMAFALGDSGVLNSIVLFVLAMTASGDLMPDFFDSATDWTSIP